MWVGELKHLAVLRQVRPALSLLLAQLMVQRAEDMWVTASLDAPGLAVTA